MHLLHELMQNYEFDANIHSRFLSALK